MTETIKYPKKIIELSPKDSFIETVKKAAKVLEEADRIGYENLEYLIKRVFLKAESSVK